MRLGPLAILGVLLTSPLDAQWRPDGFHSVAMVAADSTRSQPLVVQQDGDDLVVSAFVGAVLGAGVGLGTWAVLCYGDRVSDGCSSKWMIVSTASGAALGATVGLIAGIMQGEANETLPANVGDR